MGTDPQPNSYHRFLQRPGKKDLRAAQDRGTRRARLERAAARRCVLRRRLVLVERGACTLEHPT